MGSRGPRLVTALRAATRHVVGGAAVPSVCQGAAKLIMLGAAKVTGGLTSIDGAKNGCLVADGSARRTTAGLIGGGRHGAAKVTALVN